MINFHLKKRIILSIFITLLVIILTNKYWLIFKPMHVGFDIKGNGTCDIEVLLNKKDNDKFDKTKNEIAEADLDKINHIDLHVKKSRFPKRVKFIISDMQTKQDIRLSNMKIGKLCIEDLNSFKIKGAAVSLKGKELIIKPNEDKVTLIYPETLHIRTDINFDFMSFIIILILTSFLTYKALDYISDFKTVQEKSRADIIFLTIFFIFLFIPMSNINHEEISKQENRTLAKWKPLITENNEINFEFGKNFNEWFNDRFFLRKEFINSYGEISSNFIKDYYENRIIIYNKKADFSFNKQYGSVNRFLRKDLFDKKETEIIQKELSYLSEYCKRNNVGLYVMLSNDKESIYPEFYPEYYRPDDNVTRIEQVKELLNSIPKLNLILPFENLNEAKKSNMVFLPYDTHLNAFGSYIEYKTIISVLEKSYPNLKLVKLSEIEAVKNEHKCDSNPPQKYSNKEYEYDDEIKLKQCNSVINNKTDYAARSYFLKEYINNNVSNKLKLVIIGDSFHARYTDLLAESFYSVKSLFIGNGENFVIDKTFKKLLFSDKPDILIIETSEKFLQRFLELDSFRDIFD